MSRRQRRQHKCEQCNRTVKALGEETHSPDGFRTLEFRFECVCGLTVIDVYQTPEEPPRDGLSWKQESLLNWIDIDPGRTGYHYSKCMHRRSTTVYKQLRILESKGLIQPRKEESDVISTQNRRYRKVVTNWYLTDKGKKFYE